MNQDNLQDRLRQIPPVHEILEMNEVATYVATYGRALVVDKVQGALSIMKEEIREAHLAGEPSFEESRIRGRILEEISRGFVVAEVGRLKKVINATGIVLHTNLGRAPLPEKAVMHLAETAKGYCNLEYDLVKGERGSRQDQVERLLTDITGAKGAMVVNNNAAAVFLALHAFAKDKDVLVSRGQLVEIGGSFRIPDIIAQSGCQLVEVGTTNKTKITDYREAITSGTGMLLKVHTSNYVISGFTQTVSLKELVALGEETGFMVMEDLGSGSLVDWDDLGVVDEHSVQRSISQGAHLVTFSGDKLLGGPQAGILVGEKSLIETLKKHPMARVLRCDKLTLAALQSVLEIYRDPKRARQEVPVLDMIYQPLEILMEKAHGLKAMVQVAMGDGTQVEIRTAKAEVGGGSLPGLQLESPSVWVKPMEKKLHWWQERLRTGNEPVVVPIQDDGLMFHVRTLSIEDMGTISKELKKLVQKEQIGKI